MDRLSNVVDIEKVIKEKRQIKRRDTFRKNKYSIILALVVAAVLVGGIVWAFKSATLSRTVSRLTRGIVPDTGSVQKVSGFDFQPQPQDIFGVYKKNIIISNNQETYALNKKGELQWTQSVMSNRLHIGQEYLLLENRGGREIYIIKDNSIDFTYKAENNIIFAKICDNGYFVLVTKEKGYKGKVLVFNNNFKEVYRWFSGENYIVDADVSADGQTMCISSVDTSSEEMSGGLMLFNLKDDKYYRSELLPNTLVPRVKFVDNKRFLAVTDQEIIQYQVDKAEPNWRYSFNRRSIQAIDITDSLIAIAFNEDMGILNRSSVIQILNMNNTEEEPYKISGQVTGLSIDDDNTIIANTSSKIAVLNNHGHQLGYYQSPVDIKTAFSAKDLKQIYCVSGNVIDLLNLR